MRSLRNAFSGDERVECGQRERVQPAHDELRARVQAALAAARDVGAERITVEVRDGTVHLTGQVSSGTEQQSAGAIVRAVPGVQDVSFDLTLVPGVS